METISACRICLNTDVKLYDMVKYNLKTVYEDLSGTNLDLLNSSSFQSCVFCSMLLKKFSLFKLRCEQANHILGYLATQNEQDPTNTNIHSIKTKITHPYKIQQIFNIDSTVSEIKDETIDTCSDNDFDSKEFFNDFDYKFDSDDEPLSKKIKKRNKKETSIKTETVDSVEKVEGNLIKSIKDPIISQNLELNKEEGSTTVIISKWEFDLVLLSKEQQMEEMLLRKSTSNYINSRYKCEFCYKGYMTEVTYKNHMILHDKCMGEHTCAICQSRWANARALSAHAQTHARRYECRACAHRDKSRQRAKEHAQWHRGHKYRCGACGAEFSRSTTYLTHARVRHAAAAPCDLCGARFASRTGLGIHKKKAHRNVEIQASECGSCGAKFKNEAALKRHGDLAIEGICDTKLSWCETCGEGFASGESYSQHATVHQNSQNLTCTTCSRRFCTERSLSVHLARAHGPARRALRAVCELCGHTCSSVSALAAHQRTHSGEKPHSCSLCHKRFSKQQLLQIHMRTHTGERPFQCARCPKAFKHKAALNRHDRVHTGVRPYRCGTCGKSFSQSNSMKQHAASVHLKTPLYARKQLHLIT